MKKRDEEKTAKYGRKEILDDKVGRSPERDLLSAVIFQAILNVNFRVKGWEDDLHFLSGGKAFAWICEQLGLDPKRTSICATRTAFGEKMKFAKRV